MQTHARVSHAHPRRMGLVPRLSGERGSRREKAEEEKGVVEPSGGTIRRDPWET